MRLTIPAACAALALLATLLAPAPALAGASGCAQVLIMGFRGAGDDPPSATSMGMGDDVQVAATEVADWLDSHQWSVSLEGVPYPGVSGPQVELPSQLQLSILGAAAYVLQRHEACPGSQIALVAQSEGAAVLNEIVNSVPSTVDVMFGNPLHLPGTPYDWKVQGNQGDGVAVNPWVISGTPPEPIAAGLWPQLRSYCLQGDFVCGGECFAFTCNPFAIDPGAHTAYRDNRQGVLDDAVPFMESVLAHHLPPPGGWTPPPLPLPPALWPGPIPPLPAVWSTVPQTFTPVVHRRDGLFLYNPSTGASFVDFADGSGGWTGVKGPTFSAGWNVYPGRYNGDGLTDLFVYNPTSGASYVDLTDGRGGWNGVKGPQFSAGWSVFAGDLNADGLTDLFVYNSSSGASYVELADGAGGWAGVAGPQFSAGWAISTGDFNGDGLTDLFDYNPTTGASYVDLADGRGGWLGVAGPQFSTGWTVSTGDFDGNGLTDLFVYNRASGASSVELGTGDGGWTDVAGSGFLSRAWCATCTTRSCCWCWMDATGWWGRPASLPPPCSRAVRTSGSWPLAPNGWAWTARRSTRSAR